MKDLDYGIARMIAKEVIDLVNVAQNKDEADEIHMIALYLLGTFKTFDDKLLFK